MSPPHGRPVKDDDARSNARPAVSPDELLRRRQAQVSWAVPERAIEPEPDEDDGQTRVPASSELGWDAGVYRLVVGRNGDRPVVRAGRADANEPLTRMEWLNLVTALYFEARSYGRHGDGAAPVDGADDPETAGEDAVLGPPSVAGA